MSEPMSNPTPFSETDLARVADGSLDPERAAQLQRRAQGDPELAAALAEQEHAVALMRAADVPAPLRLRSAVADQLRAAERPAHRSRLRLRFALPAVATAAVVALLAVLVTGAGTPAPTLAQTVRLTLAAAVSPAPAERNATLDVSAAGIPFPYWQHTVGWRAVGARTDLVSGRRIVTVFYAGRYRSRVGYAIVPGDPIATTGGRVVTQGGVRYRLARVGGAALITWLRRGHTCVIAGRSVAPGTLLALAADDGRQA